MNEVDANIAKFVSRDVVVCAQLVAGRIKLYPFITEPKVYLVLPSSSNTIQNQEGAYDQEKKLSSALIGKMFLNIALRI